MSGAVSMGEGMADNRGAEQKVQRLLALPIVDIVVPEDRARSVDKCWVEVLARVIEVQGLTNPITVREVGGRIILVSGLHCLAAFKLLGREVIPGRMSSAASDDEARLEEVLENLARHELNALDRCHHLYELKKVYERLHPEAKNGGNHGNQYTGGRTKKFRSGKNEDTVPEFFAFSESAAEATGLSRRSIELAVKIWRGLSVASRRRVSGTWVAGHQANLKLLSEQTPTRQEKVLDLILGMDGEEGQAANVSEALYIIENGKLLDFQEKRVQALTRAFGSLKEHEFEVVMISQVDRILAWLKKAGKI